MATLQEARATESIGKMGAIRQQLLQQLSVRTRVRELDPELADAMYSLLRIVHVDVTVDGWALFRLVQEADDHLAGIGLMYLLPTGSVPIAVDVRAHPDGFAWSAQVGREDDDWCALTEARRWKSVYLYASGDLKEPRWVWRPPFQGIMRLADTSPSDD